MMDIRVLQTGDWPAVVELLTASELDPAGLGDHSATTLLAWHDHQLQGCAALEVYGSVGLVRSVAVASQQRGNGLGSELVAALLEMAEQHAIEHLYLLTTTAAPFFARHGFQNIDRAGVDPAIHASIQWQSVCPVSATVMHR